MRKVVFVHDGPRWKDETGTQFGTAADLDMFERYKYLGENISFAMRVFNKPKVDNLINLNEAGLFIHAIKPFNRPATLINYFNSKNELRKVVSSADILVIRVPSTIGSVALRIAEELKKPYILEIVACPWDSLTNHSFLGKLYAPFSKRKLEKLVLNAPFAVYVTTAFLQSRYPNLGQNTNISNVILKHFPISNPKANYYHNFSIEKTFHLATLAVVNIPYKGQRHVMKAMKILSARGFNLHYHIAGGGDSTALKSLAKELDLDHAITFYGKLPHHEVFELLGKIDLYVQPSEVEGLPRALIEAMSRGCVAVGSNVGGIPELLSSEAIFKSKNVPDLARVLEAIFTGNKLQSLSDDNFKTAKSFDFEILEQKRRNFYDNFLKSLNEK